MTTSKQIRFKIEHLDPLGQGVFKHENRIYFIPKTLPGECGIAEVKKSSKGVNFASLIELDKASPDRISPFCKHYASCHGCQYQHVSYEKELEFKVSALQKHLSRLQIPAIQVHSASSRHSYRNRIQLHYNKKKNCLGFINSFDRKLIDIDCCPLGTAEVQQQHQELWKQWKKLAQYQPASGHVEIFKDIHWNQSYAQGGFSQVNAEINQVLVDLVREQAGSPEYLLDLFSGAGNLSRSIQANHKYLVDFSPYQFEGYFQMDLFDSDSLIKFQRSCPQQRFDLVVIDPPRKGFPLISSWLEKYPSERVIYVSCNPATLARDLQQLPQYQIQQVHLLDMFPSTHHFETMVCLQKKQ